MSQLDVAQLISRCREGDAIALDTLIQTYKLPVYRLALSMLCDPIEADEATQDVFVAIWDRLDSYRGESKFATWLYAIALNVCRGRLRKRRARERLGQALRALLGASGAAEAQPEHVVMRGEADSAVWRAISSLDERQREPIVLRYYHDLSTIEIAQVLGVSERTVRARLHAAHEQLRARLAQETHRP